MPLLQMLSNQEPPPQLLLCTEPPLTPWDSGQPGNHGSSPHSLFQHDLSRQPQQQQQRQQHHQQQQHNQQQQRQQQQQQNHSQHQPQQQSQQWQQQGQQRIQYACQFNQPVSATLPPLAPSPHTSTPPTPLPTSAPSAMRPAMYADPSTHAIHANLAPTAERSTVGGNSESNSTTGLCLPSNVCDRSTWEQSSRPGKRLKRDPGSSASLVTALGSGPSVLSNVLAHSNSNAPAPALAPALALATAFAVAAAPASAARDKTSTPGEEQPMERNFIDALSLSPSSLSLACSLAPPQWPEGESHTGEGLKEGGFVRKGLLGKNLKGKGLLGEVVLGEGCSPAARGPSLNLPGFCEPTFPELSLSLGRL
ncbi:unnamed protein product [Closterium sp. NIES-54]